MKNLITDMEYTLQLIKAEKDEFDPRVFQNFIGLGKTIIFGTKNLNETQLSSLFSLFVAMVNDIERTMPGYIDFLLSRSYLYPKAYNEVSDSSLETTFLLIERDFCDVALCKTKTPSTMNLFRFFASIQKKVK